VIDDELRRRALVVLGPHGDAQALEALTHGELDVVHDVLDWEGTGGTVHGHRVIVRLSAEIYPHVAENHAALDGLARSVAAAMAERGGQALADLRVEQGAPSPQGPAGGPYRTR
jgi:hypothetical protein